MKIGLSIAFTIAILCINFASFCQYANLEFIENKGQWDNQIKFKGVMTNGAFFLQEKGFRVLQHNPEDLKQLGNLFHGIGHNATHNSTAAQSRAALPPKDHYDKVTIHSHAYDVQFINASTPVISGDKPLSNYNNYFIGNDRSKWTSNCKIYQAITYGNMYPGIDVRYYTSEGKLKYDIVVKPGADVSKLAMRYAGADGLEVKNEQLLIKTSVGTMRELEPYAYQIINGQKKQVACRFKVGGNTVQFVLDNYLKNATLVIDPTLIFSTFTGSTADNWGYTATYGPDGSFYAGGIVFGEGFPTSPGAFQTTYGGGASDEEALGGYDIGIMKFSPDGRNRTYATYIGGKGNEHPHSLVVDAQGELIIGGRSNSEDFPTTAPNFGTCQNYDIVLVKLNASGSTLIGSRKIGGKDRDGINIKPKYADPRGVQSIRRNYGDDSRSEVIIDNSGNIWLASSTQSSDFPKTPNAFQKDFGGKQDGVIIKATSDLSNILLSSYIGGSENDAAFVLAIRPFDGNIYLGGNTVSPDLPGDKSGVLHPVFQGGETDGFVSIIASDGRLLKTSYMGTAGNDMVYGVQFDRFSYPYIMGTTSGSWPVLNAAFSQPGGKQFIAKLKPDLSGYEYSTVFGTNSPSPNISPIAFLVDRCENVYVSGWGGSIDEGFDGQPGYPNSGTNGLTVTPDAIQSTTDNSDFYFFVLERDAASQLYGSFFGQVGGSGEHVDGGTSRFDRNGVIYQAMCANCGRDVAFPTTPGVWSPDNGSTNCNLAAVKIAFNLAGVTSSIKSSIKGANDTTGCVPLTVDFSDTLAEGKRYQWNFGDGTGEVTTTTPNVSHTFNAVGTFRVRLISIDSAKCNVADTAYTNIRVRSFKALLDFNQKKLQPCDSFNYEFTNTSTVSPPSISFSSTSFVWDFGDNSAPVVVGLNTVKHSYPAPGSYNVKLYLNDSSFCNSPDSVQKPLRISQNVKAGFVTAPSGCAPYNAAFENTSAGGQQFIWNFGDGTTSNDISPEHLYTTPGTYVVKLKVVDSATCNMEDSISFTVQVGGKPKALFTFTPDPPQENTPVQFLNSSLGAVKYVWKFGDGDSLLTTSVSPITHIFSETKTFNTCLVAINSFGCPDTICQNIAAIVVPVVDVPNAFTPNNDGINDKVFVRGYGIRKMTWRIYNRWGAVVFQTNDSAQGWDGTYNGSIQPKEVYHYVLDVEFSDNTKYQKKGDITLLR